MTRLLDPGKGFLSCCWTLALSFPMIITSDESWANTETVLYSFQKNGGDGNLPAANLINVHGTLYSTTVGGGTSGEGTVFSINPSTGAERVLYSFRNNGTDGANPDAGLVNVHGTLYGTTERGGATGGGTIYSIDPSTGAEKVVYSFQNNGTDGSFPLADLIDVNGMLYGTTIYGGSSFVGTIFSFDPSTDAESVLHMFSDENGDGYNPQAGLISVHGTLYGTTALGGTAGLGTVFSISPSTGAESVLHSFGIGADGSEPLSSLINFNGTLYGTTAGGGSGAPCGDDAAGCGIIFSVAPRTGKESVLYAFQKNGADGTNPDAGLVDVHGTLFGTTQLGGTSDAGTVFSVNPSSGAESALYSFQKNGTDGTDPYTSLTRLGHALYGTTTGGGTQNEGTVFKIKPRRQPNGGATSALREELLEREKGSQVRRETGKE